MDQNTSADLNSNTYFFLSNFNDTLKAGKNSLVINPTNLIVPNSDIVLTAYDVEGNELVTGLIQPTDAKYFEQTNAGLVFYINVPLDTPSGMGKIQITSTGLEVGNYTGSIAYYNGRAYKLRKNQKTPLLQAPASKPLDQIEVLFTRDVLIDPTQKTDSEVRFFDSPFIEVTPEIYDCPVFPTASYVLSSGSFSSIAVLPKNNADGDFDYQFDKPIYQLYWKGGAKFSASMEGEQIRIKSPTVKKFTYTNYTNNQISYEGILTTDFIAKIETVVNDTTILLDIPFSTVADLIGRSNQDSTYSKNNLVNIKGYGTNNNPYKQTVYHKKNFYVLSIDGGGYEIIHKNIVTQLPRAIASGSALYKKLILDIDFNNTRVLSGNLSSYKIYGRSLNSPETKTLLCQGKIKPSNLICSTKFDNGLFDNPGDFYNPSHVARYWLIQGSCGFSQTNQILMNGVTISHVGNASQTDYVLFKDNTSTGRTAAYLNYNLLSNSYWYGKSDAFINFVSYPSASYVNAAAIPQLVPYISSQENLTSGSIHDSNPIVLKKNALYEFSMNIKAGANNTADSVLNMYFVSGNEKIKMGYFDNTYKFTWGQHYSTTFFSDSERYGTIMLVPIAGSWNISKLTLAPYQALDYSVDTFKIKMPIKAMLNNELYEIEAELYDSAGRLAYGEDSYTFTYNHKFLPLKKQIFLDPLGITLISSTGGGGPAPYVAIVGPGVGQQSFP